MHKFYEVQKGQVVKVKKYDRFSVAINRAPAKKRFFQGIDSLKIKKQVFMYYIFMMMVVLAMVAEWEIYLC